MKSNNRPRVYIGGPFLFKYAEFSEENIKKDFRYSFVGDPFIEQTGPSVAIGEVDYVGPFYYYKRGLGPSDVVAAEIEAIKDATHVFLVFPDGVDAPGTLAELVFAATELKHIDVYYEKSIRKTEVDSTAVGLDGQIHHPYWYPFLQAKAINPQIRFHECESATAARDACLDELQRLSRGVAR